VKIGVIKQISDKIKKSQSTKDADRVSKQIQKLNLTIISEEEKEEFK
jgi:hypothetical protein